MSVPQSSPCRLGPPVSGAYMHVSVQLPANTITSTSVSTRVKLPAGMEAVLVDVQAKSAAAPTSDPALIVGNSTDTDGYVASGNLVSTLASYSIAGALAASGRAAIGSGGIIVVTGVNDTGDKLNAVTDVHLFLYVTEHASNIPDV